MTCKNLLFTDRLDILLSSLLLTGKELAKNIGVSESLITEMRKERVTGKARKFWRGLCNKYPDWEPFLRGETDIPPGKQTGQRLDVSLAGIAQDRQLAAKCEDPRYVEMIDEITMIMNSRYGGVKDALYQNVREFAQAVRDKREMEGLKETAVRDKREMDGLKKTTDVLVNKVEKLEDYINNIKKPGDCSGTEEDG
jgi:hypothetical protein